jgi:Tol biopolymer transport system component
VWTMRPDGSRKRLLTRGTTSAKDGLVSPDGGWIVCYGAERFASGGTQYDFDVQLMRSNGAGRRFLTRTRARETTPRWSADGSSIFYVRRASDARPPAIWTMAPDGRRQRFLTAGTSPRPAPDGRRLLLARQTDGQYELYVLDVLDLRTDRIRRLTHTRDDESAGGWSPDGRRIVFTRFSATSPEADVFVARADGTNVRRLTRARGQDVAAGWSPDGRKILFTSERDGREQVYVMDADGSRQRNLSRSRLGSIATAWQLVAR